MLQVGDARRLLKALQALEAALPAAGDSSGGAGALPALQSRLEAAELAGVAPHHPLLAVGRAAAKHLVLAEAGRELRLAAEQLSRPRANRYGLQAQRLHAQGRHESATLVMVVAGCGLTCTAC